MKALKMLPLRLINLKRNSNGWIEQGQILFLAKGGT
jgi:hypothetical protein